jgi:DNA-binding transcriptional LysR family regulator
MLRQAITLEALEVLDAIDRKGSFAAAAEILYKVPSALTYTIQKLEQDLGVTLFVKQGRKSVLTPAGRVLLERGRELLAAAERLTETTRETDSGWETRLNIAIDTSLGTEHIYPLLAQFYAIKPDIEINLLQEALAGGWDALMDKRADLAIGQANKLSGQSAYCCEPYLSTRWVFAVAAGHPLLSSKQAINKADIENYRAVVIRDSSLNHAKLSYRLFSKQPVLSVQSMGDKISAQKAGLGVGYLPEDAVATELASGELVQLDVDGIDSRAEHFIGWRRGEKGRALRWFIDRLKAQAQAA